MGDGTSGGPERQGLGDTEGAVSGEGASVQQQNGGAVDAVRGVDVERASVDGDGPGQGGGGGGAQLHRSRARLGKSGATDGRVEEKRAGIKDDELIARRRADDTGAAGGGPDRHGGGIARDDAALTA